MFSNSRIDFKIYALVFLLTTSCSNSFSTFSNKSDKEALYYTALEGIRKGNYDSAIAACVNMPVVFTAEGRVAEVCASAYAGKCGFNLLDMVGYFSGASGTLLDYMMSSVMTPLVYNSSAADITNCSTAIDYLRGIGAASVRTDDENAFMILLSIWTMGITINETADANDDDVLDGGFDACGTGQLSDANAQIMATSFWELSKSVAQMSTNATYTALDTALNDPATGICKALNTLGQDTCASTTPTAMTAAELKGLRSLVKEGAAFGINQCGGGATFPGCSCP